MTTRDWTRRDRATWGALAIALLVRFGLVVRDLTTLDRFFVLDDTYYTLSIARSLGRGLGPTADGVVPTNGFQPLLAFLLAPAAWLGVDGDALLRLDLVLLAVVDVMNVALLALVARRFGGRRAGAVAAAIWALSPIALRHAFGGLETSLAIAIQLLFVLVALDIARSKTVADRSAIVLGAVGGLALLARVDSILVLAPMALMSIPKLRARGSMLATLSLLVLVAPWWITEARTFGTLVPERPAVRQLTQFYLDAGHPRWFGVEWGVAQLAGMPLLDAAFLRLAIRRDVLVVDLVLLAAMVGTYAFLRRPANHARGRRTLYAWAAGCLVLWGFYTLGMPAFWFMRRYFAPLHAFLDVAFALAIASTVRRMAMRHRWRLSRASVAASALVMLIAAPSCATWLFATPPSSSEHPSDGATGHREVALAILPALPENAVMGSMQSGAFGYYASVVGRPGVRVINLDGVVDHEAAIALRDRTLGRHVRRRGMTHFADWASSARFAMRRGGDDMPELVEIGPSVAHGTTTASLYVVR